MGAYNELQIEISELNSSYRKLKREMENTISSLEQLQIDFGFPYQSEINVLKQVFDDLMEDHKRNILVLENYSE